LATRSASRMNRSSSVASDAIGLFGLDGELAIGGQHGRAGIRRGLFGGDGAAGIGLLGRQQQHAGGAKREAGGDDEEKREFAHEDCKSKTRWKFRGAPKMPMLRIAADRRTAAERALVLRDGCRASSSG
ncbi:hypothetical protein, partial [Pseudomonas sp. L1(2025)]|uniref:hypothetical protein n=1 Tax=Pseudomonas sp. L1(2025) TaxID=3449429 RepID=UPI003F69381B